MIAEQIFDEHLEHRNFDRLAFAGALAMKKRRRDRVGEIEPDGAVGDRERHVARLAAPGIARDRGDAGQPLDQIVIGGLAGIAAAGADSRSRSHR